MSRINMSMFTNLNEMTAQEFDVIKKSEQYEIFSQTSVNKFIEEASNLLEKGENNELTEEGFEKLDLIKAELGTLSVVTVLGEDFKKSIMYLRKKQVASEENKTEE